MRADDERRMRGRELRILRNVPAALNDTSTPDGNGRRKSAARCFLSADRPRPRRGAAVTCGCASEGNRPHVG